MPDRELVLEVLTRYRESLWAARRAHTELDRQVWGARARAFDEMYTELKGRGYAAKGV